MHAHPRSQGAVQVAYPMTVYAVFREGVYRHECGGVFSTLDLAKAAADTLADREPDNYHGFDVVPFELDTVGTELPANEAYIHADAIDEPAAVYTIPRNPRGDRRR